MYADLAARTVAPGGHIVLGTFAPSGPAQCFGLPVERASGDRLAALLAPQFDPVRTWTAAHRTPSGQIQQFAWLVARRAASDVPRRPGS